MSMTRQEVYSIFRLYSSKEFESVPKNDSDIDYEFSDSFIKKMDKLIKQINERVGGAYEKKRVTIRAKTIGTIAAAMALLLIACASVSAYIFDGNIFGGLVEFYDDHIRIRFDKVNDNAGEYKLLGSNLAKELAENGISPVLLPEAIISTKCMISSVDYDYSEFDITVNINFSIDNKECSIHIIKYSDIDFVLATDFPNISSQVAKIEIGNLSIYVFEQGKTCTIVYQDGLIYYSIDLPYKLEESVEFAKSIK